MKCLDPILCYSPQSGNNIYRHFSMSSFIHKSISQQVFNCGQCIFCRKKKALELSVRCVLHASLYLHNSFLTLTYDESKKDYHNELQYKDIQDFKKKLRSYCDRKHNKKIQIFNVHEYGKNGKKHWHLILFNHDFHEDRKVHTKTMEIPLFTSETLNSIWGHGFSTIGDVSEASALYTAQYAQKDFKNNNAGNSRKSKSNHSGLGKPYFTKHYKQILTLGYIPFAGKKIPLPRYFERIAHKHWSHYYEPTNFHDTLWRKALFRPFKKESPNLEMANLYTQYKLLKDEKIQDLTNEWEITIQKHLTTNEKPDFIKSAENALYDLKNKTHNERF